MRVRMKVSVSGLRSDGKPWPPRGQELDVPDGEGADLCAGELAEPVADRAAETATAPDTSERRRPGRPRKSTQGA